MSEGDAFSHETFLSPFTWRYGTDAMRTVWSNVNQRKLWRRVWIALASAQAEANLVSGAELADLKAHAEQIDLTRAGAVEAEIHHDLMAELRTFAEQCPVGGGILHLGATSADIQDNSDVLRLRDALELVISSLRELLGDLAAQIETWSDVVCMGFTHLQPAEPTTIGYRLAQYGQDLIQDWQELARVKASLRGKGIKGAVGTSASYAELLAGSGWTPVDLEARVMDILGLEAFAVTTQTYPRKQDWLVLNALAGMAGSINKLAFDVRLLQSPPVGEWSEPFRALQVGSSAMPFKRNPILSENLNSLARWVAGLPRVAWDNAAMSLLERTLDDSASRRLVFPAAFLAVDEMLCVAIRVVRELRFDQEAIARNLDQYGTFAATERLLMTLGKAGADRQAMHERLRTHSMAAWKQIASGRANPLPDMLCADETITQYVPAHEARALLDASRYVGDAPERARRMAAMLRETVDLQE